MIRIVANGEIVEALSERPLSNGLFEVELVSNSGKQVYRAIMSEIKIPGAALCEYLIEHLPKVGDLEEHEVLDMGHAIMREDKGSFALNDIADVIPYLVRINLISYEKKQTPQHGIRYFFKRAGTTAQIKSLLSSPPPLSSQGGGGESSSPKVTAPAPAPASDAEPVAEPTRKKKKKKKKLKKKVVEEPKRKKKKVKCCDDPHPVKSKKTGKRRCKNCGAKLGKKKVSA